MSDTPDRRGNPSGAPNGPTGVVQASGVPVGDPLVGTMFAGRWVIQRPLTSGGMGSVYVATHSETGRLVALKVIKSESADDRDFVARFRRETGALAAISHPNVVTFLDSGVDNGNLFLVMELLAGKPLRDEMTAPMEWRRAFRICADVCRALASVHKQGIVHRDLKPENIFLQESEGHDEFAKLIDFGIVRLQDNAPSAATMSTKTGAIVGTPGYISPEQLQGKPANAASDVYAVGVMLYEMLTGRFPFEAPNINAMLVRQLIDPIVPPRVLAAALPARAEEIVLRMMARDPADRVGTAKAALAFLLAKETGDLGAQHTTEAMAISEITQPPPRPTAATPIAVAAPALPVRSPRTPLSFAWVAALAVIPLGVVAVMHARPSLAIVDAGVRTVDAGAPVVTVPAPRALPAGFLAFPMATVGVGGPSLPKALAREPSSVRIDGFAIAQHGVTVAEFQKYLDANRPGTRLPSDPGGPATSMSHDVAAAYCSWLAPDARLPTEDEWERAVAAHDARLGMGAAYEWTATPAPLKGWFVQRGERSDAQRAYAKEPDGKTGFRCALTWPDAQQAL